MSNLDQALQIMSDYWDAAYCEGSTGINQSANANDCLHRMRQLLQAHDGEVVAWLHTVRDAKAREGDTDLALSFDDHSFPLDSIGWVSIKAQPLYTAPPRVVDVDGERYRKLVATGSFTPALNPERTPWGLRMSGTPATKQELDSAVDAMEAK